MPDTLPDHAAAEVSAAVPDMAAPAFARLIDVMGPIRDSGMRIAEFLGETAAGATTGQHDLAGAAQLARSALGPLADEETMASRLSQATQARSVLDALRSRSVALRAIASLSKLTARSMGSDRFEDYTENLSRKSSDLGETATRVKETLGSVTDHIASAGTAAQDAIASLDILLEAVANQAQPPVPTGSGSDDVRALAEAAIAIRDKLKADVNGLVSLMQFSDAYAQRMEHIETLAGQPALSAITRAQLGALAADTREAIAETQDRIARLSALAREAAGQFREDGMAADALRRASMHHAALDTAVRQAASVSRAANVVREGAEVLQGSMHVAREALAALQDQSEDIGLSAINSLLLARGDERTSKAMSNLAAAVGEHARSTSAELDECKRLMERLTEGSETMASSIVTQAEALETILSAASRDLQAENIRAEGRRAGESSALEAVGELERALNDATEAIAALRPVPLELEARMADHDAAADLPDRAAADAARTIYTMQRERDVHDAVLGLEPGAEVSDGATDDTDIDDIFF
jgi:hypothetical protein